LPFESNTLTVFPVKIALIGLGDTTYCVFHNMASFSAMALVLFTEDGSICLWLTLMKTLEPVSETEGVKA
jgi:hypothetical protein